MISIILLTKEKFIQSEIKTQSYQYNYLSERLSILEKLNKQHLNCKQIKDTPPINTLNTQVAEVKVATKKQKYSFIVLKKAYLLASDRLKKIYSLLSVS
ncbi:Uncharacterised protein [Actinobacillus equuli]|nr:Uncharacterised protein [Actinobacillus equuli]